MCPDVFVVPIWVVLVWGARELTQWDESRREERRKPRSERERFWWLIVWWGRQYRWNIHAVSLHFATVVPAPYIYMSSPFFLYHILLCSPISRLISSSRNSFKPRSTALFASYHISACAEHSLVERRAELNGKISVEYLCWTLILLLSLFILF